MRNQLSEKYIRGHGIEIGGLHYPLHVLPGCVVDYVDRMSLEELKKSCPDVRPVENKIIVDDAEYLSTVADGSQDFLIANHVLEHCHDPIGTLRTWARVLRPGGIVFAAVPDKPQTFDAPRKMTTIEHVIRDYDLHGHSPEDRDHYREWFSVIDKMSGDALESHVEAMFKERCNIHFHCWDMDHQRQLMEVFLVSEKLRIVEAVQNGAEIIWILRAI